MLNLAKFAVVGADEPVRQTPENRRGPRPAKSTPAEILRREHGRVPLDCTAGEVRQDWAAIQAAAVRPQEAVA